MRKTLILTIAAVGLAACTPPIPDSGDAGVGFTDYGTYLDRSSTVAAPPVTTVVPPAGGTGFSAAGAAAAIDRADGRSVPASGALIGTDPNDPNRPRGNAPAGIRVEGGEMQPKPGGISDEQDFNAVSQRETIESDKARIERNRATYTVDQPGALPQRQGDAGGGAIVAFALATTHAPGTAVYQRSSLRLGNPQTACNRFASPDLAQEAFLANGGPERDRKSLDPDGDGFACAWDPRPFRTALQ